MAPSIINATSATRRQSASMTEQTRFRNASAEQRFEFFRSLVPLASQTTYVNASFVTPSNLIIHEALARYAHEALHHPQPKPLWQSSAEDARALVARYVNTTPSSIAFTRDTTEALGCFIRSLPFQKGDNVIVLDTEHPNHVYGWMALRSSGLEVVQVPTMLKAEQTGEVVAATASTFAPYVNERTRCIGLSSVMFHSGQRNDVKEICDVYRAKGIHVLVDMTQQVGFAAVDVVELGVSAAAFGFHKGLNCPTGIAALYIQQSVLEELDPVPPIVGYGAVSNARPDLLVSNDPVEYHTTARRYEHLNLSLIGTTAAKAFLTFYLDTMGPENVESHLYTLGDALRRECKILGIDIVGQNSRKYHAPHLYILPLKDLRWAKHLDEQGVIVTLYRLGIRVSFGFYNNLSDVMKLVDALKLGIETGLPLGHE